MSQVSGECVEWGEWGELRVLSNGLRALQRLENLAPDGAPSLPFYRPRERPGVHTREKKEKKKEKKTGKKRALELRRSSSPIGGPR
jgi:hypothetical protein